MPVDSPENTQDRTDDELTWSEVEQQSGAEIDNAIKYTRENVSPKRTEKWDRYYGRPLGNERPGKSQYMSRDLLETVEWIMPTLMKTFAAGDPKIKLKVNGDKIMGDVLMAKMQEDLSADNEGTLYTNFYTWFKDALVSGTAFIKVFWERELEIEEHTFTNVGPEDLERMNDDEDIEVKTAKVRDDSFAEVITDITKLRTDDLACENIPHWEFAGNRRVKSINDEFGKGHVTIVTLDYLKRINEQFTEDEDEPFFRNLDELDGVKVSADPEHSYGDNTDYQSDERTRYMQFQSLVSQEEFATEKGSKGMVQLTEWYTRLDIYGTGFLVDCIVWRANGMMIRYEVNEQGFIGMASLSPMIDCYKFYGLAYSELIIEIQNLKTMLLRRILDNFDFQNSGRWVVKPGSTNIDLKSILENAPGEIIRANPNDIQNIPPAPFDPRNLTLLEYFDGVKENRTGSTRYNQGTDADSLNKTATGISLIQNASIQRIELIARLLAEGVKDFYHKSAMLYQQNLTEPFEAKIKGKSVMISPEDIQGHVVARVDMGVTAQVGQAEAQKVQAVAGTLTEFNKQVPGIYGTQEIYNSAAKYVQSTGFEVEEYVAPIEKVLEAEEQGRQQQQAQQQATLALEDRKLKIDEEKNEIAREKNKIEMLKIKSDEKIEILKAGEKGRQSLNS